MSEKRAEQLLRRAKRKARRAEKSVAAEARVPNVRGKFTGTGNRCGHRPDAPLPYIPPPEHDGRPHPLCDIEKQGAAIYKILRKKRPDGATRMTRSEARDAMQVACCCGIHYLNRKTMTIEIPPEKGNGSVWENVGVGYALIAKRTGLKIRRVQRAFAKLYKIGWVVWKRDSKRLPNGQLKWLPSLREFTRDFFLAIKKAPWYDSWTGRAEKKAQKQARAAEAKEKAKEAAPTDPLAALYQRVLRRLGDHHGLIGVRIWKMIADEHKRDEEELVTFGELAMAANARAPP
jgi:hypothetical protein